MSWLGLRHKGAEILFPEEWNLVVDGLDLLKQYTDASVKYSDLLALYSDILPGQDNAFDLGGPDRAWSELWAYIGYFNDNLFVQGKQVLKDGDPVQVYQFLPPAKDVIDTIYQWTKRPVSLQTQRLLVGTTPVPLSDVDMIVKRIHIKVPSSALYLVYVGDQNTQEYILEPGDNDVFEIENPRNVYVRSLGNVEIHIALEA